MLDLGTYSYKLNVSVAQLSAIWSVCSSLPFTDLRTIGEP